MVDAENLAFSEDLVKCFIQVAGGLQVAAKRLFNDDTAPTIAIELSTEPGNAKLFGYFGVHAGRDRTVEAAVSPGSAFGVESTQSPRLLCIRCGIVGGPSQVIQL